jgi:prephenate dehydrogenase
MMFSKVAVLGPGLLGGSIALALQKRRLAGAISLYTRHPASVAALQAQNLTPWISTDPAETVRDAELVVLCVPIGAMKPLVEAALPGLDPFAIVTDVGSVKAPVVEQLELLLAGQARWIGSHPMAGSEQAGFGAARADLFQGATTIVTPTENTDPTALAAVEKFWQSLGSQTLSLSPSVHDQMVAKVSHLPHLVAAALVHTTCAESLKLAGPGFRDTTRIAAGPADMWQEILMTNQTAIITALDHLIETLQLTRRQLVEKDEKGLHDLLAAANHVRSQLTPR